MNLATGQMQQVRQEGNYRTFPASWLPSGKELMIGLFDPVQFLNYGARIQSLETGKSTDVHLAGASYMTIAPDGKSFVFSDWRNGQLFIRALYGDTTRTPIPARGFAAASGRRRTRRRRRPSARSPSCKPQSSGATASPPTRSRRRRVRA